jgi:hypothetical protein
VLRFSCAPALRINTFGEWPRFFEAIFLLRQFVLRQVVPRAMRALRHIEQRAYNGLRSGMTHTKVCVGTRGVSKNKSPHNAVERPAYGNWMGENR